MDFVIRLRAEGTAETRAQADAVRSVRTELEATIAIAKAAGVAPKAVLSAAKDKQKKETASDKSAEKITANAEKNRLALEKSQAREESTRKKAEERKTKDLDRAAEKTNKDLEKYAKEESKSVERKSKELARATEKADKDLEKYTKDEGKVAEQRAAEAIEPEMRKLSLVEKAQKKAADNKKKAEKKADEELAERIDPSLKKLSATAKAKEKFFGGIGKSAMLAGAASSAALIGIASKLAPLAIGVMGMARIQMISAQAGFNMRRLFMGTNPRPLLDALQRTSQLIDPRTFTGATLGEFLKRSADSTFALLAKAEPYARLFFKGLLNGALQVENTWLKLRIAIQPALNMFPVGTGLMTAFGAGALTIKAAFGLMGAGIAVGAVKAASGLVLFGRAAVAATGPLLPFIAAVVAWKEAWEQAIKLKEAWDENSSTQIGNKLKADLGLTSKEESDAAMSKRQGILTGDDYDKRYKLGKYAEKPVATPKNAEKQAAAAGPPIGKNLGLGMLAGMKDVQGKVEAGGRDLVLAAEGGAKKEAVIRSPSDKWRREIGRQLGAGAVLGLEDSAADIEEAGRAAMPSAPGVGASGGRRGGVTIQQIGPFFGMPEGGEQQVRRWVFDALDDAAERIGALA